MNVKAKAHSLQPIVQIGKNGLTQGLLEQIETDLKKQKLIKIKIRSSALKDGEEKESRKEIITQVLEHTHAELIQKVGNVFTIYKR